MIALLLPDHLVYARFFQVHSIRRKQATRCFSSATRTMWSRLCLSAFSLGSPPYGISFCIRAHNTSALFEGSVVLTYDITGVRSCNSFYITPVQPRYPTPSSSTRVSPVPPIVFTHIFAGTSSVVLCLRKELSVSPIIRSSTCSRPTPSSLAQAPARTGITAMALGMVKITVRLDSLGCHGRIFTSLSAPSSSPSERRWTRDYRAI